MTKREQQRDVGCSDRGKSVQTACLTSEGGAGISICGQIILFGPQRNK